MLHATPRAAALGDLGRIMGLERRRLPCNAAVLDTIDKMQALHQALESEGLSQNIRAAWARFLF